MKKMNFETGTRNVKQSVRRFTDKQRRAIIHDIDNRPSNVSKTEMFEKYGMSNGGNLYYVWKKKFGMKTSDRKTSRPMNVNSTVTMNVPTNTISINRIVVEVKINSVDDLMRTFDSIKRIKGVKSVTV